MPGFGVLVLILLFGLGIFGVGVARNGGSSSGGGSATASASTTIVLPPPAPRPATQADSGTTVNLGRSGEKTVRLSHRWHWSEPHVTGPVELQRVDFLRDPGYDEWKIVPTRSGTATITATGSPGAKKFRLTVRVG